MLSRVADNLYWLSRYLERAEHTARLLDVNLSQMLDETPRSAGRRWQRLLLSLSLPADAYPDPQTITNELTFNASNQHSILYSIETARENARQVREQISSEMWLQLNRLYHQVRQATLATVWQAEAYEFYQSVVKEGVHLFQGITDATLNHGEGWHFLQAGRYIERAVGTAALLDVFFETGPDNDYTNFSFLEWVDLLKSCTSFEAYCKVYTSQMQPEWIAEFLLLNAESPRSVRFAGDRIRESVSAIVNLTERQGSDRRRSGERVKRLAGRLQASLDYGLVDEIMDEGLHAYCAGIRQRCEQLNTAIYQAYINPAITSPGLAPS